MKYLCIMMTRATNTLPSHVSLPIFFFLLPPPANMMSALVAQEFRQHSIPVVILHPGFNKTEMTAKYAAIWEVEGAVDAQVGARRVLHEVGLIDMERTGKFFNCEDGLMIPW